MTRRDFLTGLFPTRSSRGRVAVEVTRHGRQEDRLVTSAATSEAAAVVAVIAGRHCLAYQGTFCSTCRERCPMAGAIVVERGLPRVVSDLCNGCRICHEVCPAPVNAIHLVTRRTSAIAHA